MKNVTTHDLIQSLCISIERRVRAEDILLLSKTGPHAAKVKKAQREERAALKALNAHLRQCISVVTQHKRREKL